MTKCSVVGLISHVVFHLQIKEKHGIFYKNRVFSVLTFPALSFERFFIDLKFMNFAENAMEAVRSSSHV